MPVNITEDFVRQLMEQIDFLTAQNKALTDTTITPFIDLNGKGGRPPVYKDDFTIDSDGVPICKAGCRMHRNGTGVAKGRTKFKCPNPHFKWGI